MKRRRLVTVGIVLMAVAVGWLLRELWLPSIPLVGERVQAWKDEWGETAQSLDALFNIIAGFLTILGGLTAGLGLRRHGESILPTISVTTPDAERAGELRAEMRDKVHHLWVKDVLHKSIYRGERIELGMTRQDQAVSHRPFQTMIHLPNQADTPIPSGTQLATVFSDMNKSMLILGEKGAGKTTGLLTLVEQVLAAQEPTSAAYVPVVFNLSSWAEGRLPLDKWLVEELQRTYQIKRELAETWLEDQALGLFLDGLDDVKAKARDECVEAINKYRNGHGLAPVCVCCRREEYEAISQPLALHGAVLLSPLTRAEVGRYLDGLGSGVEGLSQALTQNEELWTLAGSPLNLAIMALTFHEKSRAEVMASLGEANLGKRIFATYVEHMFTRAAQTKRVEAVTYTRDETMHWLGWLAHQMRLHNQTSFLIERLQPDWYGGPPWHYMMIFGLIGMLIFGLMGGLIDGPSDGPLESLFERLSIGLVVGLFWGRDKRIEPVEVLIWNKKKLRSVLIFGLIFGLIGGLSLALIGGLGFGLMGASSSGMLIKQQLPRTSQPNQGISQSMRNGLRFGLIGGLISGLTSGLLGGLTSGLLGGLLGGLLFGLLFGGYAVIQHRVLHLLLNRAGVIPWDYAEFLNYAAERIFLHKVGGGYIFIHNLLLDYFVNLYKET